MEDAAVAMGVAIGKTILPEMVVVTGMAEAKQEIRGFMVEVGYTFSWWLLHQFADATWEYTGHAYKENRATTWRLGPSWRMVYGRRRNCKARG